MLDLGKVHLTFMVDKKNTKQGWELEVPHQAEKLTRTYTMPMVKKVGLANTKVKDP